MSDGYYEKTAFKEEEVKRFFLNSGINLFGKRLKLAMNSNGIKTNTAMAVKCGMSETVIRNYVNGRTYPTLDRLAILAMACNCSVNWLACGDEKEVRIDYKTEKSNINDESNIDPLAFAFNRLHDQEKELIVDFVQREGLNSLLRLISERMQIGTHYNQSIETSDSSVPWVNEEMRGQLKETLISMGFDRKRISTISMLFSLPEAQAREILSQHATHERDGTSQDAINDKQDHNKKAG
ncbi:XRE family transcriptional regulator [Limnobaculum zhutongyuii]|uniref:XRE family transcriptional regulator n=1 Tax=Limnobaculum zhutongyuii TaxID=2498113 RepID=A0A411WIF1_9GAMM|nr:helix-turn-helix transcriptional regulator [Limnobaculum zhutongyuii]QBH95965.1 XRE family transcriptional regulator [Limnobaculum zhutongyuii]TQS89326.1 XRE family transcriptional regulator [Limnobaculum zhutongyuii]